MTVIVSDTRRLRLPVSVPVAIAALFLILLVLSAIFATLIVPYAYDAQNIINMNQAPGLTHLFGTDEFGRDVLSRIVVGAQTSLSVSVTAVGFSV
ncbi:ABC transporter permease, partial [Ochrobactrum sp. SFR4]|nr:ABC transporter permease [Ochrobactrum sp. SFR4]